MKTYPVGTFWSFGKALQMNTHNISFQKEIEKYQHFSVVTIMKTCLYNYDPLKPHFYIVKLGFTGVYIIFLISAQTHRLWVLIRTASERQF